MKCNVFSCEYNNGECNRLDEVILSESSEGLYCNLYDEKQIIKASRFKLIETKFKNEDKLVVMSLSYKGLSGLTKEILKEVYHLYDLKYKSLIFDCTCFLGTKDEYRYHLLEIVGDNLVKPSVIADDVLLKELKSLTCKEFIENPQILENSILTSTQKKMIQKGIVI